MSEFISSCNKVPEKIPAQKVMVAMSGGVDSAAAALLLVEQGFEVVGVAMQVWDYRKNAGNSSRASCCAPSDFEDARRVAEFADFPFYVFDFEGSFNHAVIEPFVQSYLKGYTPNPCLDCNRKVKFHELRKRALGMDINLVATGHYAQIRTLSDGSLALFTSVDATKDQSYFLYALTQSDLHSTIFPVGNMSKTQVREFLRERGLNIASKSESQDICFISGDVAEFVAQQAQLTRKGGDFVTKDGRKLGTHSGVHNFTVGQRKGLGLSHANPLYVLELDPTNQNVVVGEKDELRRDTFFVRDLNWISGQAPPNGTIVLAKLRYRHAGVLCSLEQSSGDIVLGKFVGEWTSVSPGQAAVFYAEHIEADGMRQVLGGGIIEREDRLS